MTDIWIYKERPPAVSPEDTDEARRCHIVSGAIGFAIECGCACLTCGAVQRDMEQISAVAVQREPSGYRVGFLCDACCTPETDVEALARLGFADDGRTLN